MAAHEPSDPPRTRTSSIDVAVRTLVGYALVIGAVAIAERRTPRAIAETPIPAPSSSAAPRIAPVVDADDRALEVAFRLTELAKDARFELPDAARGFAQLRGYWRRMSSPWAGVRGAPGDREKLVELVSLTTSAGEKQLVHENDDGTRELRDPRIWNQNDGAFAMRESLVTPTPATASFHLKVPAHAVFEAAPAVVRWGDAGPGGALGEVTFSVRVAEGASAPREIGRVVVGEAARNGWRELRVDLAPFGGEEIDLELHAEASPKVPGAPLDAATAIALWGTPRILRPKPARTPLPYDVLWIVVDALRPDVVASLHDPGDDARKAHAKRPAYETALPVVPGVTPALDALARRGTVFRHAVSASHWTRPGTLAMLSGAHGDVLGVPAGAWMLGPDAYERFYAGDPPLLPLAFRRAGATTRAFVNNFFLFGYALIGVDMGFEQVEDFHYDGPDTDQILRATLASMRAHADERAFWFVNFNSPHLPYEPPRACVDRIPEGVVVEEVRRYMAEACKDDAAIGALLDELDRLGLRDRTLVVVTADHGETLSGEHPDFHRTFRFSHAMHQFEETVRIPILLSLPAVIPEGRAVDARVSSLDLAPTVLALEGLPVDPRQKGIDLVRLARGEPAPDRAMLSMGRGSNAIQWGRFRYLERDPVLLEDRTVKRELYDLVDDPGETRNVAGDPAYAPALADMKARLVAALADAHAASKIAKVADATPPTLHLRFAGGARSRRIRGRVVARGARSITATPIGLAASAVATKGDEVEIDASTSPDAALGVDVTIDPAGAPIEWSFTADGAALGDDAFFGGPLGVASPGLSSGLADAAARLGIASSSPPFVAPDVDVGVFVTRDRAGEIEPAPARSDEAVAEVERALRQWGYAK